MKLREEYLAAHNGVWAVAAAAFAADLHRGELMTFKAGYSKENALLAAAEIFPEVTSGRIRSLNNWS